MREKLIRWIPEFIKPILKPLYYHWQNLITHRKSRDELHQYWIKPYEGQNLPQDYIEGHQRSQFLVELIKKYLNSNAKILEIGCNNVGRNLNYLFNAGYIRLAGVEISEDAIDLMKRVYPEMAKQIKVYCGSVEDIIKDFEDDAFDVVFTMAVLEHIHPDSEFIFPEMVRITRRYLITIEDERTISWRHFPRNYRKLGGPDAAFSLEPEEFKVMVKSVREVEKALGEVSYDLTEKMKKSRNLSRSLFIVKDIKGGEIFTEENVRSIRPGYGLHPKYLKDVLGRVAAQDIKRGTPLKWRQLR